MLDTYFLYKKLTLKDIEKKLEKFFMIFKLIKEMIHLHMIV